MGLGKRPRLSDRRKGERGHEEGKRGTHQLELEVVQGLALAQVVVVARRQQLGQEPSQDGLCVFRFVPVVGTKRARVRAEKAAVVRK